jgi:hypothetical protein
MPPGFEKHALFAAGRKQQRSVETHPHGEQTLSGPQAF